MARLNIVVAEDSEDELPELSSLFDHSGARASKPQNVHAAEFIGSRSAMTPNNVLPSRGHHADRAKLPSATRTVFAETRNGDVRRDPLDHSDDGFFYDDTLADISSCVRSTRKTDKAIDLLHQGETKISRFRKPIKLPTYRKKGTTASSHASLSSGDEISTDLSGFIVPDSASEHEEERSISPGKFFSRSPKKSHINLSAYDTYSGAFQSRVSPAPRTIDLTTPTGEQSGMVCPESPSARSPLPQPTSPEHASDLDDPFAVLRYSPPKSKSPHKIKDGLRPVTPPSSPTKSTLRSPARKNRIPPSVHRPSIDAFWNQETINDWNLEYSPTRHGASPVKSDMISIVDHDKSISPRSSPQKTPAKSPAKRDKAALEHRRKFDDEKHEFATNFLAEVDRIVCAGMVAALSENTGGIKILWSKKLSSTAGRATWRRETIGSDTSGGLVSAPGYRHHASIELAEKVIDDESRLMNVLAHEFCHLANFMISGIKDNPHGKEFKKWASKCTRAFKDQGVEVTTKHSYTIAYKYIWSCVEPTCGVEYKRHSKSIDPAKHSCGACKGKLRQTQPVPRKGIEQGKKSEYQKFVKQENERVRRENPGAGFGEIMAILGRKFREDKKKDAKEKKGYPESSVAKDDAAAGNSHNEDHDAVIREFEFLHLKAR